MKLHLPLALRKSLLSLLVMFPAFACATVPVAQAAEYTVTSYIDIYSILDTDLTLNVADNLSWDAASPNFSVAWSQDTTLTLNGGTLNNQYRLDTLVLAPYSNGVLIVQSGDYDIGTVVSSSSNEHTARITVKGTGMLSVDSFDIGSRVSYTIDVQDSGVFSCKDFLTANGSMPITLNVSGGTTTIDVLRHRGTGQSTLNWTGGILTLNADASMNDYMTSVLGADGVSTTLTSGGDIILQGSVTVLGDTTLDNRAGGELKITNGLGSSSLKVDNGTTTREVTWGTSQVKWDGSYTISDGTISDSGAEQQNLEILAGDITIHDGAVGSLTLSGGTLTVPDAATMTISSLTMNGGELVRNSGALSVDELVVADGQTFTLNEVIEIGKSTNIGAEATLNQQAAGQNLKVVSQSDGTLNIKADTSADAVRGIATLNVDKGSTLTTINEVVSEGGTIAGTVTAGGDIGVASVNGGTLSSTGGNINVTGAAASARITATKGNITIGGVMNGRTVLSATQGTVHLKDEASQGSGSIDAKTFDVDAHAYLWGATNVTDSTQIADGAYLCVRSASNVVSHLGKVVADGATGSGRLYLGDASISSNVEAETVKVSYLKMVSNSSFTVTGETLTVESGEINGTITAANAVAVLGSADLTNATLKVKGLKGSTDAINTTVTTTGTGDDGMLTVKTASGSTLTSQNSGIAVNGELKDGNTLSAATTATIATLSGGNNKVAAVDIVVNSAGGANNSLQATNSVTLGGGTLSNANVQAPSVVVTGDQTLDGGILLAGSASAAGTTEIKDNASLTVNDMNSATLGTVTGGTGSTLEVGGTTQATASTVTVDTLNLTDSTSKLTTTGDVTAEKGSIGGTLSVGGKAVLGAAEVSGTVDASGAVTAGDVTSTGSIVSDSTVTAGAVSGRVEANGLIEAGSVNGGALSSNTGDITVAGKVEGDARLTAEAGTVTLTQGGTVEAGGKVDAANLTLGDDTTLKGTVAISGTTKLNDNTLTIDQRGGTKAVDLGHVDGASGVISILGTGAVVEAGNVTLGELKLAEGADFEAANADIAKSSLTNVDINADNYKLYGGSSLEGGSLNVTNKLEVATNGNGSTATLNGVPSVNVGGATTLDDGVELALTNGTKATLGGGVSGATDATLSLSGTGTTATVTGAVNTGTINVETGSVLSTTGDVTAGGTAKGSIAGTLTTDGTAAVGAVTGRVDAGTGISADSVNGGTLSSTTGDIGVTGTVAGGALTATAGSLTIGGATTGASSLTARQINLSTTAASTITDGAVSATTGTDVGAGLTLENGTHQLGNVSTSADGALALTNATATAGTVTVDSLAVDGSSTLTATGNVTAGGTDKGSIAGTLTTDGTATVGAVTGRVDAGTGISADSVNGGTLSATTGNIGVTGTVANGALTAAAGDISIGGQVSGATTLQAAKDSVTLATGGTITNGLVTAGTSTKTGANGLTLEGGTGTHQLGAVTGGGLSLAKDAEGNAAQAVVDSVTVASLNVGADSKLTATTGDVVATAGGSIEGEVIADVGNIDLTGSTLTTGTLTATQGNITLTEAAAGNSTGDISAQGTLLVENTTGANLSGKVTAAVLDVDNSSLTLSHDENSVGSATVDGASALTLSHTAGSANNYGSIANDGLLTATNAQIGQLTSSSAQDNTVTNGTLGGVNNSGKLSVFGTELLAGANVTNSGELSLESVANAANTGAGELSSTAGSLTVTNSALTFDGATLGGDTVSLTDSSITANGKMSISATTTTVTNGTLASASATEAMDVTGAVVLAPGNGSSALTTAEGGMVVTGSVTGKGDIMSAGCITVKDGGAIGLQGHALVGDVAAADMLVTNASLVELAGTLSTDTLSAESSSVSITGDGLLGDGVGSALGTVSATGSTLSMADDDFSADIAATATGITMKDAALTGSMQADEDSSLALVGDNSFAVTADSQIAGPISNAGANGAEATLTKSGDMLTLTGSDAAPGTKGSYTIHVAEGELTLDNTQRNGTLSAVADTDIMVRNGESTVGALALTGDGNAAHNTESAHATRVHIAVAGDDKLVSATGELLSAHDASGTRGAQIVIGGWNVADTFTEYADGELLELGRNITGFDKEIVHDRVLQNVNLVEKDGSSYAEVSINHKGADKNRFEQGVSDAITASEGAGGRLGELVEAMAHTGSESDAKAALNSIGGAGIATTMAAQMSANRDHMRTLRSSIGQPQPRHWWDNKAGCPQWVSPTYLWTMVTGASAKLGNDNMGGAGYTRHDWGFLVGGDVTIQRNTLMGLAAGYSRSHVNSCAHTISGDQYFVDLYARNNIGRFTQSVTLGLGVYDWSLDRSVCVQTGDLYADFRGEAKGQAKGTALNVSYEVAYTFRLTRRQTLAPLFMVESSLNHINGYREGDDLGNAGLNVAYDDAWTTTLGFGARYAWMFNGFRDAEQKGQLSARALFVVDVGDVNGKMSGSFIGSGATFTAESTKNSREGILIGVDALLPLNRHWSVFGNAGFELREGYRDISAGGGVRYQF